MQTFLPYTSFRRSAAALDRRRLGKQRVEVSQILRALSDPTYGWQNHPAVKMWRGHDGMLRSYGIAMCQEWRSRGYRDTLLDRIHMHEVTSDTIPPWFGMKAFHLSHQSNLVRKFPEHCRRLFPNVPDDLPYVWPVS